MTQKKTSQEELISKEMKRLSVGGGVTGDAAKFIFSLKRVYKDSFDEQSAERMLTDGEIIEFFPIEKTMYNTRFSTRGNKKIWLSQILGIYFTFKENGNNCYDYPTFVMKGGQEIKIPPMCDNDEFINFVKGKKFKVEQKNDFHLKISFRGSSKDYCTKAHDMVWDTNDNFMDYDMLIKFFLEKLNNGSYDDIKDGYCILDKLYYFYEV